VTAEEMKAQAEKVVEALKAAGFEDVVISDFEAPKPVPIMYSDDEGNVFVLELSLA
jgi:hypothetical protein